MTPYCSPEDAFRIYNVGVELRQGTGRYKDTQVVIFTPRYHLNNQSSVQLFVCHEEDIQARLRMRNLLLNFVF